MNTPPEQQDPRIHEIVTPSAKKAAAARTDLPFAPSPEDDGFGDLDIAGAPVDAQMGAMGTTPQTEGEIATIAAEGLSARQLRLARRVAFKNGIEAASDHEAVLLLRRKGINPFQRPGSMVSATSGGGDDLVEGDQGARSLERVAEPKTKNLPSVDVNHASQRAFSIMKMQRDIVRRRRRNLILLMSRLAFFVIVPTILVGFYFYRLATPFYATKSEFLVQQAEGQSMGANLGSLFRGTQFATSQDSITVQSFLQSRDAMLQLDKADGFKEHLSQPSIDPIQRLEPNASNEAAYRAYRRNVKISYDPTEGIIRMEVAAADPATSERFAKTLLRFAEHQVDQLTQRVREDQMKGARESYEDAERKVNVASQKVLDLQQKLGVLDPKVESTLVMTGVGSLEQLLREKELALQQLLDNAKPNQAKVDGVKGDIARLQAQVAELRASMTDGTSSEESLAQITGEIRIAETELQTRGLMLSQALTQLETARIEANRQVRYLTLGVSPVAPDEPTYPRAFENTALAFLIFAGIYLMLSLTVSILREQVTS